MAWAAIVDSIWEDEDVLGWSSSMILLYLYLASCRECEWKTGIYRPPVDKLVRCKTHLSQRQLDRAYGRLEAEGKIVLCDGWLWIVGKGNHSLINRNVARGAVNYLARVPVELARGFVAKYRDALTTYGLNGDLAAYGIGNGMDTVSDTVCHTTPPTRYPKPEHEKTCNPNPNMPVAGSADGKSSGSGSLKERGSESPVFEADAFVRSMEKLLELAQTGRGGRRQYLGDLKCLEKLAAHVKAGHLGPVKRAVERCVRTASEIMADARADDTPEIKRPAAVFQRRVVKALERRGHSWKEPAAADRTK